MGMLGDGAAEPMLSGANRDNYCFIMYQATPPSETNALPHLGWAQE